MKTRAEASKLISEQLKPDYKCGREKGGQFHYGVQELRELLDFIYGPPNGRSEEVLSPWDKGLHE